MRPLLIACICTCLVVLPALFLPAFAAPPVASVRAEIHAGWTPNALLVAFRVDDPDLVGDERNIRQPWLDDAVAIYLNFDPAHATTLTERCLRVVVSAANGIAVHRGGPGGWREDPAWFDARAMQGTIRCGVRLLGAGTLNDHRKRDQGYEVEIGLPWRLIGVAAPFGENGGPSTIGMAAARYAQGDVSRIDCWPKTLTALELDRPSTWGTLQFAPQGNAPAVTDTAAHAPRLAAEPTVRGDIEAAEWAGAGRWSFGDTQQAPPVRLGQQLVSVVAAWYTLDPFANPAARQPMEPVSPWLGPDTPFYHQVQLREARQAGIDAFAVALPLQPALTGQTRARLAALSTALREHARYADALPSLTPPLLLPIIDLASAPDATREESDRAVIGRLEDFYRLVPPQQRLMLADGAGQMRYPVVLTNPTGKDLDVDLPARLAVQLRRLGVVPVGWIVDDAWNATVLPDLLSCCALVPAGGMELGHGPLLSAVIMPGAQAGDREVLPRQRGETYANNWQKIQYARPDFVLIRSWNDFSGGSEIAATRQEGYRYIESTQQELLRLARSRGFGVTLIRHTLPPVLQPEKRYPVEVLVKNGSLQQIASGTNYQMAYRILKRDETVTVGDIDERFVLREFSTTRLRFTLQTERAPQRGLGEGNYLLRLELGRNKIPLLNSTLLREKLGALTLPFAIGRAPEPAQVLEVDLPTALPARAAGAARLTVRNLTDATWRKGAVAFRLRWIGEDGTPAPGESRLVPGKAVAAGEPVTVQGALPPAPATPGWHDLAIDLAGAIGEPTPIYRGRVQVTPGVLLAEFRSLAMSRKIEETDKPVAVQALLRNRGETAWTAEQTRVTYQWLNWSGQPIPGAGGAIPLADDRVLPDALTLVNFTIMPPAGAGSFRCVFGLSHASEPARLISDVAKFLTPSISVTVHASRYYYVDLMEAFKAPAAGAEVAGAQFTWAASGNDNRNAVNFDGAGRAFPLEEFLPDATYPPLGYQAGYRDGQPVIGAPGFFFGVFVNGKALTARARGQEVPLARQRATALHLVAISTGTPRPTDFIVTYTDGEEQRAPLTVANWLAGPVQGEPVLLKTSHLHGAAGDDRTQQGSLYVYTIPLDQNRHPKSLTLPAAPDLAIFAATLELVPVRQD